MTRPSDLRTETREKSGLLAWPGTALAGGVFLLVSFHAARLSMRHGTSLGLGSITEPTPLYGRFLALWTVFGGASALLLAMGLARALEPRIPRLQEAWNRGTDGKWMLYGSAFALLVPVLLRRYLLLGMPVADDEAAYRLTAEILAMGRLYVDSAPFPLFFDNRFLINDGRLFSQYFVGWPALAVPGVWLGVAGFMNAFYSALAVPPLFLTVRLLASVGWARVAVLLYLASPMLMVGAATELSHTSCFAALAWLAWFCLAARDGKSGGWIYAGAAFTFSVAFFIRPLTALGIGLPWLLAGLASLKGSPRRSLVRKLAAFALPAAGMGALFLAVNQVQHGSPFAVGYERYYEYAQGNDFRFSLWSEESDEALPDFDFSDAAGALGRTALAVFRFHFAFLGWPSSLLFVFFARGRAVRWLWASALFFVATHFFTNSSGIDAFAPVHYFELALPMLVLTVLGAKSVHGYLARLASKGIGEAGLTVLVPGLLVSLVAVTLLGYVPVRFQEIHRLARAVRMPWQALEDAGIDRAVVFAPTPFLSSCRSRPSAPLVFARPNNDPLLENDVLWVNHVSLEEDRELMELFPDRPGYVMGWLRSCEVVFQPLDELPPGSVPPARLPGPREDG